MFCFSFVVGSETRKCVNIASNIPFPTGWFKMTMTFSAPDDLKVYFDDTLAITLPPSCSGIYPADNLATLVFGRKYVDVDSTSNTNFQVDEFAFWRRILSTAEIANL